MDYYSVVSEFGVGIVTLEQVNDIRVDMGLEPLTEPPASWVRLED